MAEPPTISLLDLPNELLLDTADLLHADRDLSAFARTSRRTYAALIFTLYARDAKSGEGAALHWAATHGFTKVAERSLAQGADVDTIQTRRWDTYPLIMRSWSQGSIKVTPLQAAIGHQHEAVAVLLLQRGANVKARIEPAQSGFTVLHVASGLGLVSIMKMLLDKGLRIGTRDKVGQTPLHHAVQSDRRARSFSRTDAVSLLLQQGASVLARDDSGQTPGSYLEDADASSKGRNQRCRDDASAAHKQRTKELKQVQSLFVGAYTAMDTERKEKAEAKNKAKEQAEAQIKLEQARKKGEAHARKMSEDAARVAQQKEAARKI